MQTPTSTASSTTSKKIFLTYRHEQHLAPVVLVDPDQSALDYLLEEGWELVDRQEFWIN